MKKLLTILSFTLLLFIGLVVMFCSNEKVTGRSFPILRSEE